MESLFDIFGDRAEAAVNRPNAKNISRLQLGNENIGKVFSSGSYAAPVKPNEPLKKADTKKSFLVNKGQALQSTPMKTGTPFGKGLNNINKQTLKIYSDSVEPQKMAPCNDFEIDLEFHKPRYQYDNYSRDMFDDMAAFSYGPPPPLPRRSPTPEPRVTVDLPELNYSYGDDFFKDDISNSSITVDDLNLPSYY